jgi:hypothetical protein
MNNKMKHAYKNPGYLVTSSNSSNIPYFGKRSQFQRDKKGNKVTAALYIYFIPFIIQIFLAASVASFI